VGDLLTGGADIMERKYLCKVVVCVKKNSTFAAQK
jgi:hypothetical protein